MSDRWWEEPRIPRARRFDEPLTPAEWRPVLLEPDARPLDVVWGRMIYKWAWGPYATFGDIAVHIDRFDPNARDGEWRYVQHTLPLEVLEVELGADIGDRLVIVPCWLPDPERAAWRRRKWWGRGPIVPFGCNDGGDRVWCTWAGNEPCCEWPNCLPF